MAWYYGEFSCGHEGRVNIVGPTKDREWKKENEFSKMCSECKEADRLRTIDIYNERAAQQAIEMELPELIGTPKQVSWATTLRQNLIDKFDKIQDEHFKAPSAPFYGLEMNAINNVKYYILTNETSASFFINSRSVSFVELVNSFIEKVHRSENEEEVFDVDIQVDVEAESTIRPERAKTETRAKISTINNKVIVEFGEYREDMYQLMKKEMKFSWKDGRWERLLNSKNGDAADRAAEVGHRLLAVGFIVIIHDNDIRAKAAAAEYEPECTNWITCGIEGKYNGWLFIGWDRGDDYYRATRLIPESQYYKPYVVVPATQFEEVLYFAARYGFKVSEKAGLAIEAARLKRDKELVVAVAKPADKVRVIEDGKPKRLSVIEHVEIDEELRDN